MDGINRAIDNMREYVCDTLCKFRDDNSLTQEELEAYCEACKLEAYTCDVLEDPRIEAVKQSASWKDRMMNSFMRVD